MTVVNGSPLMLAIHGGPGPIPEPDYTASSYSTSGSLQGLFDYLFEMAEDHDLWAGEQGGWAESLRQEFDYWLRVHGIPPG